MNEPIVESQPSLSNEAGACCSDQPRFASPTLPDLSVAFIVLTLALVVGTILHRQQIMYCVNDGSRLDTVYYLVQHGTYEFLPDSTVKWAVRPPKGMQGADGPISIPVLFTIDMIRVNGKYCSSKPPLFPTCLAGIAWLTQKITGITMHDNPWVIVRTLLIVCQVLPLAICLILLRRQVFLITDSPFARSFSVLAACLGTYLTPWVVTINNHVPAAALSMITLDAAIRIWYEGRREWYWFTIAGFFAALTAAFELPAGLLAVTLFVLLLIVDARKTLKFGLVAAIIPAAAALTTNYIVTGQLMPAYESWNRPGGFYDYPGSYWNSRMGIDALNEPWHVYLANMLVGHDGFFSLTPLLLVALLGIGIEMCRQGGRRLLAGIALGITAAVVCTYLYKTRNYGGGCMGLRWLFWVLPMWLIFLPVGVEIMSRCALRRACLYVCLAVSVFSVSFAWDHPWMSTWIRLLFRQWGWIDY